MMSWRPLLRVIMVVTVFTIGLTAAGARAASPTGRMWHNDLSVAWKHTQQTRRPLVLFVTMDGCYYCEKMSRETYADRAVAGQLSAGFVPVAINQKRYPKLVEQLQVQAFPTTVIIGPDARILASLTGFVEAARLQEHLSAAQKRSAATGRAVRR